MMIALAMRTRIGMHGTDDGKLISALGHIGHQFTNMRTRDIGRDRPQLTANLRGRVGLEIVHVDVARTAQHPQQNAVYLTLWLGGLLRP